MTQYIPYSDLNEFYSIKAVCRLLEMDKENLKRAAKSMASSLVVTKPVTGD